MRFDSHERHYTLGIDIGSTASKCIMLKNGKDIVAKSLVSVGAGTSGPQRAIEAVLEAGGKKREDMAFVLATGYGRNSLMDIADKQMSELRAMHGARSSSSPTCTRSLISADRTSRSCTSRTVS